MAPALVSSRSWLVIAAVICVAGMATGADGQSMSSNSASYNAGYGRYAGQENHPVDFVTRDANGNRVIVDGLILSGEDQSSFARASGAADAYAGAGALGGSTAIGNNLTVVTQGNYNTVIVNSHQTNTGAVTANSNLNGGAGNGQ
jgi:holdfast attachment protein HfaA